MPPNELSTNLQQLVAKILGATTASCWKSALPAIEEIEAELQSEVGEGKDEP